MSLKKTLSLCLVLVLVSLAMFSPQASTAATEVKVIKDGVQLAFPDQKPVIENGRTLVPVRFISEALGASVDWHDATRKVTILLGGKTIALTLNQRQVSVDGVPYILDVAAKTINGRTMVPLRFVSEVLGATVEWNEASHAVLMTTVQTVYLTVNEKVALQPFNAPVNWTIDGGLIINIGANAATALKPGIANATATTHDGLFSKDYIFNVLPDKLTVYRNTNFAKDHVEINIQGNNRLEIKGATLSDNKRVWVQVKGSQVNIQADISPDKTYSLTLTVDLPPGAYTIAVFMSKTGTGSWSAQDWDIPLVRSKDGLYFSVSPMLTNNVMKFVGNQLDLPAQAKVDVKTVAEEKTIRDLATTITAGLTDDYQKILSINNWVADNIYYDYDAFTTGKFGRTDAIGTLEAKRSVCAGYAALTAALVRSLGIPCKVVSGFARGVGADSPWAKVDHSKINHAWNEAYVNGRWVIMDTTWNSRNMYEKGVFNAGEKRSKYFDPTLAAFSLKHKIMK